MNEQKIFSALMYGSYKANRGYGMSHESLVRLGIGTDAMKEKYEKEKGLLQTSQLITTKKQSYGK